ncbi:8-oxoguanine DNA glycosylase OGG fold protein [Sphingobacterium corticibacter]|uniref:Uncharacterized protein n=1 Tax=Sphingobacterium corticibacter TaxID=2171749 RepID=A0A2T8HJ81_9SPHI|nr:hypothetical protein [Sphingobacterium corticibacter]PVH25499.1 hypothetical protein DC487_05995 [Sphingobacterium corticibacter]
MENYKTLIAHLPVQEQSFTTKRTTWLKAENHISWLKNLNDRLFENNPTLTISRHDIFETQDIREKIILTIYWGYTAGMRGNHFVNILHEIEVIENRLITLSQTSNLTTADYEELRTTFKKINGLGLSTYSKLLYFFKISFNNAPCLILDQRLIDTFVGQAHIEFHLLRNIRYENAEKLYLQFLDLTQELAIRLSTTGENIELFLFTFGKNLKTTPLPTPTPKFLKL